MVRPMYVLFRDSLLNIRLNALLSDKNDNILDKVTILCFLSSKLSLYFLHKN